jgi:hypothetical protein
MPAPERLSRGKWRFMGKVRDAASKVAEGASRVGKKISGRMTMEEALEGKRKREEYEAKGYGFTEDKEWEKVEKTLSGGGGGGGGASYPKAIAGPEGPNIAAMVRIIVIIVIIIVLLGVFRLI